MKNFCLYNGKKIVKPEIWNITSVELSSDYTSAIIQAESKVSTSQYTLDIIHLIENQYSEGSDSYITNTINSLTGATEWTFDNVNKVVVYEGTLAPISKYHRFSGGGVLSSKYFDTEQQACEYAKTALGYSTLRVTPVNNNGTATCRFNGGDSLQTTGVLNPAYDPLAVPPILSITYQQVTNEIISKAESGDTLAQNSIISIFNKITDGILDSDYSEFFEQNKQPK